MHDADTAGRVHPESAHPYRGPFQRDRDRIVHSAAFRRLAHKTQVFTGDMGDYHRSRLTHTLEVASIARTVGRTLRLNEDLIEALALLHDIGHPPFGHAGEDVLDERLAGHGGFSHNRQALRIVELLETRYPNFPGLNLSREVLAGQQERATKKTAPAKRPGRPLEVQVVDAADSVAYDAHDADDAVELGLLTLGELDEAALWRTAAAGARKRYAALDEGQFRRAAVHELIDLMASDLVRTTLATLKELAPANAAAVVQSGLAIAVHSTELAEQQSELERLLFERVYRHPTVLEKRRDATTALGEMFDSLLAGEQPLPEKFAGTASAEGRPRAVADYLAGMTDRFAWEEFHRAAPARG
jgi:dGTPase